MMLRFGISGLLQHFHHLDELRESQWYLLTYPIAHSAIRFTSGSELCAVHRGGKGERAAWVPFEREPLTVLNRHRKKGKEGIPPCVKSPNAQL